MDSPKTRTWARGAQYPCAPRQVWQALTHPETLRRALGADQFDPHLGCGFFLHEQPAAGSRGVLTSRIVALRTPELMTWRCHSARHRQVVRFALEPSWAGTELRLELWWTDRPGVLPLILRGGYQALLEQVIPQAIQEIVDGDWHSFDERSGRSAVTDITAFARATRKEQVG